MKPKVVHQQAMEYSFKAKQAMEEGSFSAAFELYKQAADLESQVAEFYFDKPETEPTRSIVIRSAAFMNLKAGLIEKSKKFIFFGLLNSSNELIRNQLNNALELAVSLDNYSPDLASREYNYLNLLRYRSVHYTIEPNSPVYGRSVSLEMITDFSNGYLKSLKAYALSKFKRILKVGEEIEESVVKDLEKLVNPLVTSSAYGSFKFSIANDFLFRQGENKDIIDIKANVVSKFHNEVFTNPLNDQDIETIKADYSEEEVNEIFRPLIKIKSNSTSYKIGYYDVETFDKKFASKIVNKQRKKLLPPKSISKDDIGELESSIIHRRSSQSGKVSKKTIFKEQLKAYEFDIPIKLIEPMDHSPLILSEEIVLIVNFDSNVGFTISFDDFRVENSDIEYEKTLVGFHNRFYNKVIFLAKKEDKNMEEQKDWDVISKLIGNPGALLNK